MEIRNIVKKPFLQLAYKDIFETNLEILIYGWLVEKGMAITYKSSRMIITGGNVI